MCGAVCCSMLQSVAVCCNVVSDTLQQYTVLQYVIVAPRLSLRHTATEQTCCNTLQHLLHTAKNRKTLQHTTTHYNTLHYTTTHYSTLQHTATHSSTPDKGTSGAPPLANASSTLEPSSPGTSCATRSMSVWVRCSVLQCVAVSCSVLQCLTECCSKSHRLPALVALPPVLCLCGCVAQCDSVWWYVAVGCSMLQCVAQGAIVSRH